MESLPGMCVIGDHNGAQKLVIIIINFYKWLNKGLSLHTHSLMLSLSHWSHHQGLSDAECMLSADEAAHPQ